MESNPYAERKERNCLVPSAFTLLLAVVLLLCVGAAPPTRPPLPVRRSAPALRSSSSRRAARRCRRPPTNNHRYRSMRLHQQEGQENGLRSLLATRERVLAEGLGKAEAQELT